MRIILVFLIVCLSFSPAYAYKEDNRTGETQLTAGEQNAALHRLSDKSSYIIKQLKKADEYVARRKSSGEDVLVSNLESLLNSEQEDRKAREMIRISALVTEKMKNIKTQVVITDRAVYENLEKASVLQVKDAQMAGVVRRKLGKEVQ